MHLQCLQVEIYKINLLQANSRAFLFLDSLQKYCRLYVYEYIEDIYFFYVNTKYILSNVMKISVNSRARSTSEFYDIFNT